MQQQHCRGLFGMYWDFYNHITHPFEQRAYKIDGMVNYFSRKSKEWLLCCKRFLSFISLHSIYGRPKVVYLVPFSYDKKMSRALVGVLRGVGQTLDKLGRSFEVAPFIEGCTYKHHLTSLAMICFLVLLSQFLTNNFLF